MSIPILDLLVRVPADAVGAVRRWWSCRKGIRAAGVESQSGTSEVKEVFEQLEDVLGTLQRYLGDKTACQVPSQGRVNDTAALTGMVSKLLQDNQALQQRLETTDAMIEQQEKKLQDCKLNVRADVLTELATRRIFDQELLRRFHEFQRTGSPFALVVLEIDLLGRFRNIHGQEAADEVLRGVAAILRQKMRNMDLVARYGEEQFAAILPATTVQEAQHVAERARSAIEQATFRHGGAELAVTASLGVAECLPTENLLCLVGRAEDAVRQAQYGGRNATSIGSGSQAHGAVDSPLNSAGPQLPAGPGPQSTALDTSENESPLVSAQHHSKFPGSLTQLAAQTGDETLLRWYIEKRIAEWKRTETPFSVIMWHLDKQQELASVFGRHTRALMARMALRSITASVRDMDVAAQCGLDTYALLLPFATLPAAQDVAERVLRSLRECRFPIGKAHVQCTLSIGVVEVEEGDDVQRVLERAEAAMIAAMEAGGDGVQSREEAQSVTIPTALQPESAGRSPPGELCMPGRPLEQVRE